MRIAHVHISNFLGIVELDFDAGDFTLVTGKNAAGKSSVIKAIRSVMEGGHDATLIRDGADQSEVVLVFDDGMVAKKTIKPEGSDLKVTPKPAGIGPQTFINAIQDRLGVNPVGILAEDDDKVRAALVMDALDLTLDMESLHEAIAHTETGDPLIIMPEKIRDGAALKTITAARKACYDSRTEYNRQARNHASDAKTYAKSLPDPDADEVSEEECLDWVNEYDAKIEKAEAALRTLRSERDEWVRRGEQLDSEKNTRGLIEKSNIKALEAETMSEELTAAMERIDQLKLDLLQRLPFGIGFTSEGALAVDEIPYDNLNTQAQIDLALRIAMLRANDKGPALICVDGIERLDPDHQAAFKKWATKNRKRAQFVATAVTEGDLSIETSAKE